MYRVGIIGTGGFARTHADALARRTGAGLAGFLGRPGGGGEELAARFGVPLWRSFHDVVAGVDLAVVATPHESHVELACRLLQAGLDVLVEKPIARTVDEADRIVAAAKNSRGICIVGHLMRYAPAHAMARDWIADGVIGRPVLASSRRFIAWDPTVRRAWQKSRDSGGGMWLIQGVHVIDQLSWLLDQRAAKAFGVADRVLQDAAEQDADDLGLAILEFPGVRAQVTLAGYRRGRESVVTEILGSDGVLRVSHRGTLAVDRGAGWQEYAFDPELDHWTATVDAEWDAVLAAVRERRASVDAEYGRYVVAVVDAVRRSHRSGVVEEVG